MIKGWHKIIPYKVKLRLKEIRREVNDADQKVGSLADRPDAQAKARHEFIEVRDRMFDYQRRLAEVQP